MNVILISGIFMSFFIVLLLLTKKGKALPDKILVAWVAVIGIHLLGFYYNQAGYWEKYPHLIGVTAPVPLFHGPLLYLYCLYALLGLRQFRPVHYLHFVPGVAAYLYMFNFFFFYSANEKIGIDAGKINDFSTFTNLLLVAIFISGLVYATLSYGLTTKHKQKIKNQFSFSKGISLTWLRYCIVSIGLVFLLAVIVFYLRDGLYMKFPFNPEYIFYSILVAFIFYIGYFGIKHENIFVDTPNGAQNVVENKTSTEKYRKSGMKEEEATRRYEQLLYFMDKEKPYLNPKLNLYELAGQLDLSINQLSQIINQKAKVNFHDFVNQYRVEEFLRNAEKKQHFSLLALALESGFNSKSTFNSIFKKFKGLSPSQYLAQTTAK